MRNLLAPAPAFRSVSKVWHLPGRTRVSQIGVVTSRVHLLFWFCLLCEGVYIVRTEVKWTRFFPLRLNKCEMCPVPESPSSNALVWICEMCSPGASPLSLKESEMCPFQIPLVWNMFVSLSSKCAPPPWSEMFFGKPLDPPCNMKINLQRHFNKQKAFMYYEF